MDMVEHDGQTQNNHAGLSCSGGECGVVCQSIDIIEKQDGFVGRTTVNVLVAFSLESSLLDSHEAKLSISEPIRNVLGLRACKYL